MNKDIYTNNVILKVPLAENVANLMQKINSILKFCAGNRN